MGLYYIDGTKVVPGFKFLGYTFLPARKFKLLNMYLSESVTSLYKYSWLPLDFFALDKIPVKVEGVYEKMFKRR